VHDLSSLRGDRGARRIRGGLKTIWPDGGAGEPGKSDDRTSSEQRCGVVNGVAEATFTVEFFARGSFSFTAQYLGSSQFEGSTSNAVTVNVF
jgi:hypothetical protein